MVGKSNGWKDAGPGNCGNSIVTRNERESCTHFDAIFSISFILVRVRSAPKGSLAALHQKSVLSLFLVVFLLVRPNRLTRVEPEESIQVALALL